MEHEGGRFRRRYLVPPPEVESPAELNERLTAVDAAEDARHIHGRPTSAGFDFEQERPPLRPLPTDEYDTGIDLTPVVHRNGRVTVRQCYCSVPARFIGTKVQVKLKANEVRIFGGRNVVACHPRLTRRYTSHDIRDHYLEILLVKPGVFAGAAAPAQARAEHELLDQGHPLQGRRARTSPRMSAAPAARSRSATCWSCEPLVKMSSTSRMVAPVRSPVFPVRLKAAACAAAVARLSFKAPVGGAGCLDLLDQAVRA